MKLDFHVHTTISDGKISPEAVYGKARRSGLRALSITDHDAVEGSDRVAALAEGLPAIVPGAEFSVRYDEAEDDFGDVHVLGYFPAGIGDDVRAFCREAQDDRRARLDRFLDRLAEEHDVRLSSESVLEQVTGRSIGKPHVARALLAQKLVPTFGAAFQRHLGSQVGLYPPPRQTVKGVIQLIREGGGISVWAHPRFERLDGIDRLIDWGLDGIEAFHRRHSSKEARQLESLAEEKNLLCSGGSDWHGPDSHGVFRGISISANRIRPFLERVGLG